MKKNVVVHHFIKQLTFCLKFMYIIYYNMICCIQFVSAYEIFMIMNSIKRDTGKNVKNHKTCSWSWVTLTNRILNGFCVWRFLILAYFLWTDSNWSILRCRILSLLINIFVISNSVNLIMNSIRPLDVIVWCLTWDSCTITIKSKKINNFPIK